MPRKKSEEIKEDIEQEIFNDAEIPEDAEFEEVEEQKQAIPFSKLTVYIVENVMKNVIKDEQQFREFAMRYEQSTLPVLETFDFDGAMTRILGQKQLDDKQVVMLGLAWVGISTFLNALPYMKKRKKKREEVRKDENNEGNENKGNS